MYFPDYLKIGSLGRLINIDPSNLSPENIGRMLRQLEDAGYADSDLYRLLDGFRMVMGRSEQNVSRIISLEGERDKLKSELAKLEHSSVAVKPYKNLYIFILSHPKNEGPIGAEILGRINYLDKITRDVVFIMPGYRKAKEGDEVVNESDANLKLAFDENLFVTMIQELEDKSGGKFKYNDDCELVFVGQEENGGYDFDNFCRLNLNLLRKGRGINPVKLIISIAQKFREDDNMMKNINGTVSQILGEMTMQNVPKRINVFIAGAKKLSTERSLLREELSKLENAFSFDIRSKTFEDFDDALMGQTGGRQTEYNMYIRKEADAVIFIFDTVAGRITEEEFNVAYESLRENGRPAMFVYVKKKSFPMNLFKDKRLRNIQEEFFNIQGEYYTEYKNLDELRYLFYRSMSSFFNRTEK